MTLGRTALLTFVLASTVMAARPAAADELPAGGWKDLTVGVLPVQYLGRTAEDLFHEEPGVRRARQLAGRLQRVLEEDLEQRDQLKLVRAAQVRERLSRNRDYRRTVELAARFADLGVTRYNDLQAAQALADLDRASVLYREVFADIADPDVVADADLYRGLVLTEQGELGQAHVVFRELLLLDPTRRFDPGYYPAAVEKALGDAQADIGGQANKLANRYPLERLEGLAELLKVDVWVIALIDGPPDGPVLRLAIYDHRTRGITSSERLLLADPEAEDRVERTIAAWSTCAVEAQREKRLRPPPRKRWFLDIGYVHGLWLTHRRTRELLQTIGGHIAVTYEPTKAFQLYFRGIQLATLPDSNGDLLDVFVTTRLGAGAGLVIGKPAFRFFARTGLEVGLSTSAIDMTTDVDCKHFGSTHPRCGSVFTAQAPAVWVGIDFSLGSRIELARGWYLTISTGVASYVYDPTLVGDLNFPWYGTIGFGAPF